MAHFILQGRFIIRSKRRFQTIARIRYEGPVGPPQTTVGYSIYSIAKKRSISYQIWSPEAPELSFLHPDQEQESVILLSIDKHGCVNAFSLKTHNLEFLAFNWSIYHKSHSAMCIFTLFHLIFHQSLVSCFINMTLLLLQYIWFCLPGLFWFFKVA